MSGVVLQVSTFQISTRMSFVPSRCRRANTDRPQYCLNVRILLQVPTLHLLHLYIMVTAPGLASEQVFSALLRQALHHTLQWAVHRYASPDSLHGRWSGSTVLGPFMSGRVQLLPDVWDCQLSPPPLHSCAMIAPFYAFTTYLSRYICS